MPSAETKLSCDRTQSAMTTWLRAIGVRANTKETRRQHGLTQASELDLGRGSNDHFWRWQLRHVEVQDFHERADLRKGKICKLEEVSGAGLRKRPPTLPAKVGLGLAHSLQTRVDETGMVEPLSMLLEVFVVDAATPV